MRKLRVREIKEPVQGPNSKSMAELESEPRSGAAKAQALHHRTPASLYALAPVRAAPSSSTLSQGESQSSQTLPGKLPQPPLQPSPVPHLESPDKAGPQNPHMPELKVLWSLCRPEEGQGGPEGCSTWGMGGQAPSPVFFPEPHPRGSATSAVSL